MNAIVVKNLEKHFKMALPYSGPLYKKLFHYLSPPFHTLSAVNKISFTIQPGERVAFIGPNGAGKSTTIKILTGIMQPSMGQVEVLGLNPSLSRQKLAFKMGAVFGQRSQLWYHLPVKDTLYLLSAIYEIKAPDFRIRLNKLAQKFEIQHLLNKPVRQLSLGERMRCELVASLLHNPSVLFLDEPTIGLDITAKATLRDLIREESINQGVTLLLTSHDTDDIEKVCDRVIIIDQGKLLLDDSLDNLKTRYIRKKVLSLSLEDNSTDWSYPHTKLIEQKPHFLKIEVDITQLPIEKLVAHLLKTYIIKDMSIEAPPLESIIQMLYSNHEA
ncbi:MAG: natA [Francisellaceae bacterium]|nr:natA [Francisellaceae bacterium]